MGLLATRAPPWLEVQGFVPREFLEDVPHMSHLELSAFPQWIRQNKHDPFIHIAVNRF